MGDLIHGLGSRSSLLLVATAALAAHAAQAVVGFGGETADLLLGDVLHAGLIAAAAIACTAQGIQAKLDRRAWLVLGAGLAAWALASILPAFQSERGVVADVPAPTDAVAVLFYVGVGVAMYLLARDRVSAPRASLYVDASIAALAALAFGAALSHQAAVAEGAVEIAAFATDFAYRVGNLAILATVAAALAFTGWRPGRSWILAAAGVAGIALGDLLHVHQAGAGFRPDGAVGLVGAVSAVIVCYGAFEPVDPNERSLSSYWRVLLVPMAFAFLAVAVLVYNELRPIGTVAFGFAIATLLGAIVRPALGFRENVRVLSRSKHEALTDALTGLGNRRKLMIDLREQIRAADVGSSRILILFDLDGFKQYNDTFGHPAGDALLARLGANLQKAVGPYGGVYRMGGDEFCVLLKVGVASARTLTSIAAAALSERGEGFAVKSSYGAVMLPQEAREPARALRIADQRMYSQKEKRRPSTGRQTRDILLQVLRERDPDLSDHMSAVGELSRLVGQRLKLLPEELDETVRAAELHDIGKMAIPDAILHKPGPLDEKEWAFVHKHTIIGERILSAAPALGPVAKVVRSSHERWDGGGYPDKLAGDVIPVGSRIVAACDAFHAMTSARPYGTTLTVEEGLSELRKAAGTEFDPRVVEALCEVVSEPQHRMRPPGAEAAPGVQR
jgi:diguanylate cyclase (GGDEF)-like protein